MPQLRRCDFVDHLLGASSPRKLRCSCPVTTPPPLQGWGGGGGGGWALHTHLPLHLPHVLFLADQLSAVCSCEMDAEPQEAPPPVPHHLMGPPGGGPSAPMVDKWAELSRHPDFQAIYKEAILRAVRELRADPTRVAITMPWDLHQSCQLMMTDGGAVTLEGNHPHFCMDDHAFITEMTGILFDGATLVVHDRMRSLLRYTEQNCNGVGRLKAEALTGFIPINTVAGPDDGGSRHTAKQGPCSPPRAHHIAKHVSLRLWQLAVAPRWPEAEFRTDDEPMLVGRTNFKPLMDEEDHPLRQQVGRPEILLPHRPLPPASGFTHDDFAFDTCLPISYISRRLADANPLAVQSHQLATSRTLVGADGVVHAYQLVLLHAKLYFQNAQGEVEATRDLQEMPIVDLPAAIGAPGWAGCWGADVTQWGAAWVADEVTWSYAEANGHGLRSKALILSPPHAVGRQLVVAATGFKRVPLPANHPSQFGPARLAHLRYLGAQVMFTALPYVAGSYSVLSTLDIYLRASQQLEQLPWVERFADDYLIFIMHISPYALAHHRHSFCGYTPPHTLRFFADFARGQYLTGKSQALQATTLPRLQEGAGRAISTHGCAVGWYEGATGSQGGRRHQLEHHTVMSANWQDTQEGRKAFYRLSHLEDTEGLWEPASLQSAEAPTSRPNAAPAAPVWPDHWLPSAAQLR